MEQPCEKHDDFAKDVFNRLENHGNDLISHKEQILHLQAITTELICDVKDIKNRLLNRPPIWVGIALSGLCSLCSALAMYVITMKR